jgi:hypothetical protein
MLDALLTRLGVAGYEPPGALPRYWAAVAEFETPELLLRAVRTARAAGYQKLEAFSPFPIHGIDEALGESRSPLGRIVLCAALVGMMAAILLQWWTGAVDYKLVIAGKPLFALEPSIPIIFELSVLFGAFGAVFGMFHLNRLPTYSHPFFSYSHAEGASNNRFLLAIEAADNNFDASQAMRLLTAAGGAHVEAVER